GAVFAPHVLYRTDVTPFNDYFRCVVITVQDWAEMDTLRVARESGRVIRRPRQKDRRTFGTLRQQDDGMQLHAVTHGNHHVTSDVLEIAGWGREPGGCLTRESRIRRRWLRRLRRPKADAQESGHDKRAQREQLQHGRADREQPRRSKTNDQLHEERIVRMGKWGNGEMGWPSHPAVFRRGSRYLSAAAQDSVEARASLVATLTEKWS